MGSASAKPRASTYACGLFLEIHRQVKTAAEDGIEPDAQLVAELLADALAHPDSRKPVLLALAAYITIAMAGGAPDPESFCNTPK